MQPGQVVVHLAHGGGTDWPSVERYMVGGAKVVAGAARQCGAAHLVFVSSIAALYLGDASTTVRRSDAARPVARSARGLCPRQGRERAAAALPARRRTTYPSRWCDPALVVGPGTSPFHSGVGEFNRETHCLGWNAGDHPLPFVLASDVAAAMAAMLEPPPSGWAAYNLVGDVRPSARAYIAALAQATGRPLRYHPRSPHDDRRRRGGKMADEAAWRSTRAAHHAARPALARPCRPLRHRRRQGTPGLAARIGPGRVSARSICRCCLTSQAPHGAFCTCSRPLPLAARKPGWRGSSIGSDRQPSTG